MKLYHYCLGMLCLLLAAACGSKTGGGSAQPVKTVRLDTVRSASSLSLLQYPGKVKAAHDISVAFRVSGTIEEIAVEEGIPVRKGQLLARLDPTDYEVQLQATEAQYRQVKAEAERVIALYEENGTTPNDYDKARYGLQQIEAKYKNHRDQLEYTRLYAPFDGYVQQKLFDEHETVAAGMPVVALISRGTPEVELSLPASEYIRRASFERYTCTFDVYPGRVYPLTLIGITEKANANQLYTMRLRIEGGAQQPLPSPGMNTMVSIACRTGEDAVCSIPAGAICQQDGKAYVYIYVENEGRVRRTEVHTLRLNSDGTALVNGGGLNPGDRVVASGARHISDGEQVEVLPPASPTNEGGLL